MCADMNTYTYYDMTEFVGQIMTGYEFNNKFNGIDIIKLTNATEIHNGFKFEEGLNIDKHEFQTSIECYKGGIYFTQVAYMHKWILYNINIGMIYYQRRVFLPNDAKVYIEDKKKFKVDKLILGPREMIDRNIYTEVAKKKISLLEVMPSFLLNKEICLENVKHFGSPIQFVPNDLKDREICLAAVNFCGSLLKYVPLQLKDKEMCDIAIKNAFWAIRYVPKEMRSELSI